MRIDSAKTQQYLQKYKKPDQSKVDNQQESKDPVKDQVSIRTKKIEHFAISNNSPDDPTVSTKVLDSLNMGMINFNQKERDVLATIMSEKAKSLQ